MPDSDLTTDPLLESFPIREGYKVLGGVVLYQKLGQGGMGAVYRGKHPRLNVDVAVKVMAPPEGMSPSHADNFVQRFIREAQTSASVRHSNLIRVYDVNTEGGSYYLVMDYIDGESAGDRLKRKGKLAEREAVEIVLGAAEGLAEAHAQSIVHRDVKPDNILIDKKGAVVVADLGLAKAYGASPSDSAISMGLSLTQQAMGTPYYMSPEQSRSAKDVGPAADVWSLGVTLYQLVSSELPWSDTDLVELLSSIRKEPAPDVRGRCGGLSDGLCAIIERALNKEAAGRYADCGEMAKALSGHLDSIRQSSESVLQDPEAGATRMALVSVTPPPERTLTLIAEADVSRAHASQKAPAPPKAEAKWYYAKGETRHGPVTTRELQRLAARGEVTPEALIWKDGMAEWIPASRTKGLFSESGVVTPPPLPGSRASPKGPPPLPGETHGTEPAFSPADGAVQGDLPGEAPQQQEARQEEGPGPAEEVEDAEPVEREATRGQRRIRAGKREAVRPAYSARRHRVTVLAVWGFAVAIGVIILAIAAGRASSRRQAERDQAARAAAAEDSLREEERREEQRRQAERDRAARAAAAEDSLREEKRRREEERAREEKRRKEERRRAEQARKAKAEQRRSQAEKAEKKGDLGTAVRYYEEAQKLGAPVADKVRSLQAQIHVNQAIAKINQDDWDGAIRECDQAIRLAPNYALAYACRGIARVCDDPLKAGPDGLIAHYDTAIADYDTAIRLEPRDALPYHHRGEARFWKGDWDEAIRDYDQAIQLDPKYAACYAGRAVVKHARGDLDGAIRDYDRAIQLDPKDAECYVLRGSAKYSKADLRGALLDLDTAIRLDTNSGEAYEARANVKKAMGDRLGAERDAAKARELGFTGCR